MKKKESNENGSASEQKIISSETDSRLLNWNASKGNPFDYDTFGVKDLSFKNAEPHIEIIEHRNIPNHGKKLAEYSLFYNIHLVNTLSYRQADLLLGYDGKLLFNDLHEIIDKDLPVELYLSYPFRKSARVVIQPPMINDKNADYFIGYILWQTANAYGKIFKDMWQEIGVFGHGFSDLSFCGLTVYQGNKVEIQVCS
jgi:hypothetical protein